MPHIEEGHKDQANVSIGNKKTAKFEIHCLTSSY